MGGDNTLQTDTGLACLVMVARLHEIAADPDQLSHKMKVDGKPFSKSDILLASKQLGLHAKAVRTQIARLDTTPLPAIALGSDGTFFIIARADAERVLIYNPAAGQPWLSKRHLFRLPRGLPCGC